MLAALSGNNLDNSQIRSLAEPFMRIVKWCSWASAKSGSSISGAITIASTRLCSQKYNASSSPRGPFRGTGSRYGRNSLHSLEVEYDVTQGAHSLRDYFLFNGVSRRRSV